ncbi:hypothetical protein BN7_5546 [Wickerhamomyces ciferrii]|uniref:Protein GLC8 n=1 Tax=Wickerhamomyces ciferrii (strain ATCC 14091 / BCRC 22168 / CBS 111 / JCM 3599 / NBRC 0793 / NRRL Y-1031 F-60-10) TaxID=1206466 RepID=K0KWU2_WICCF|nr:uncharacterized protein BN7_5546 [Wickerhamomyces ciferrii]CCH45959.1 hypothetical protein BN7_5546 [Wickerhamomyces ciferrii]
MGGILKNKIDKDQQISKVPESAQEFRNQVLQNTKLNALLKNNINPEILNSQGNIDPNKINQLTDDEKDKLKWNAQNLKDNEVIQKQIIENLGQTIDEPKTPFQKATQPELNEYYQDDDEIDDLNDFKLGEPEIKVDELDQKFDVKINPEKQEQEQDEEEETKPKTSFDELRKKHYHHEHIPAFTKDVDEDADLPNNDDEDDEDEPKPKKSFAELRKQHYQKEHVPTKPSDIDDDEDDE